MMFLSFRPRYASTLVSQCQQHCPTFVKSRFHRQPAVASKNPYYLGKTRRFLKNGKITTPTEETTSQLQWESFDFSDNPKWDPRFQDDSGNIKLASNLEALNDEVIAEETRQDELLAKQQKESGEMWDTLSPELVQKATDILSPYVQPDRLQRMKTAFEQRTRHTQFLFQNPSNPSNVWACLRTLDSFGIQHVHIVTESKMYQGKAALLQKQGMRTAMGSAQWLTIHHYTSTTEAVETLREKFNCRIFASDLNPTSVDVRDIDWDQDPCQPKIKDAQDARSSLDDVTPSDDFNICIVMGNEKDGITKEMSQLADRTFTLPMTGFAESFNLSVATAITLAHLSAASSHGDTLESKGPIRPGDLSLHEYNCLMLRGIIHSISQQRVTLALLKKAGIELPNSLFQKGINLGKKLK